MRKILLMTLFFAITIKTIAQEISKDYRNDFSIYALAIEEYNKTTGQRFSNQLYISGFMLTYVDEFLEEKTSSPELKKYILDNGWEFLNRIDTVGMLNKHAQFKLNKLKTFLPYEKIFSKEKSNIVFAFSPVIFSKDRKKAFIVGNKGSKDEILEVIGYFFECIDGKWKLVHTIMPYYI